MVAAFALPNQHLATPGVQPDFDQGAFRPLIKYDFRLEDVGGKLGEPLGNSVGALPEEGSDFRVPDADRGAHGTLPIRGNCESFLPQVL